MSIIAKFQIIEEDKDALHLFVVSLKTIHRCVKINKYKMGRAHGEIYTRYLSKKYLYN